MSAGVLIWGDTGRTPALRHELPLAVLDPFIYLEDGDRRAVVTNTLEDERIAAAGSRRADTQHSCDAARATTSAIGVTIIELPK